LVLTVAGSAVQAAQPYAESRRQMLREIEADVTWTARQTGRKTLSAGVSRAMSRVLRHEFVPEKQRVYAYENRPLPIGYGQTISQPYIVALMSDLLEARPGDKVLEVGTGSGYQAAVLGELDLKVFSVEIIPELGKEAAQRLQRLGYEKIRTRIADGYFGWEEHAPYDAIIVTAAATHIPPPLVGQLKPGGIMVIPVGGPFSVQQLTLVEKTAGGDVTIRQILPVSFVPLTGGE
jgi:protein-L-isoaspartate(D-aspartate) O-methyltransferase